ncbi:MAG: hypothetical protein AB1941_18290 [Gemmatimonadota bacterium]
MLSDREHPLQSGLAAVTMRAAFDRAFRSALLRDPRGAVREAFGIELPATLRLRFVEKPGDVDLLVVLPDLVGETPLSPAELERIAGGAECAFPAVPEPLPAVAAAV